MAVAEDSGGSTGKDVRGKVLRGLAVAAVLVAAVVFYRQTLGRSRQLFDFNIAYSASGVWLRGGNPYSQVEVMRYWLSLGDTRSIDQLWVVHAPGTFAIISPFTLFSPGAAGAVWLAVLFASLAVLVLLACRAAGLRLKGWPAVWVLAATLICTPVQMAVFHGQPALPCIAACVGAYVLMARRPGMAGVLLGVALCLKPHLALAMLVFLALRRRWASLAYAVGLFAVVSAFAGFWMAGHGHAGWLADWRSNVFAASHNGDTNDYGFGNVFRYDLLDLHVPYFGFFASRGITQAAVVVTMLVLAGFYWRLRRGVWERDPLLDFVVLSLACLLPFYHRWPDAAVVVMAAAWAIGRMRTSRVPVGVLLALAIFVIPVRAFCTAGMELLLKLPNAALAERLFCVVVEPFQTWSVVILLLALLGEMHHSASLSPAAEAGSSALVGGGERP